MRMSNFLDRLEETAAVGGVSLPQGKEVPEAQLKAIADYVKQSTGKSIPTPKWAYVPEPKHGDHIIALMQDSDDFENDKWMYIKFAPGGGGKGAIAPEKATTPAPMLKVGEKKLSAEGRIFEAMDLASMPKPVVETDHNFLDILNIIKGIVSPGK